MRSKVMKFLKTACRIIAHIIILGIIPLDLYVMNIDEVLAIVLTVVWIVFVNIVEIGVRKKAGIEEQRKKASTIFFAVLEVISVVLIIIATEFNLYWNSVSFRNYSWDEDSGNVVLSQEQALKDYEFAMKYLKKLHPVTLHGLPADMAAQSEKVKQHLESVDSIKGYELAAELESIYSLIGDGHTYVSENYTASHYMKHIYEHKSADDTAIGINGITYEELLKQKKNLMSFETESYGIRMLKNRTSTLEGLKYLGIDTTGDITYNYITKDGQYIDTVVTAEDFLPMEEYLNYEESVTGDDLHSEDENYDFVSYEINEKKSMAILTLDSCDYNKHYRDTVKEMFDEVHSKNIKNVVVDLRYNPGGSSMVADEFIHYLDVDEYKSWADEVRLGPLYFRNEADVDKNKKLGFGFSGDVYVITSVSSYSSAMDFAMLIQDNGLGKIVGEASGNLPASYGEVAGFLLPQSHIYMQISSKKWHRVDESKEDLQIIPDIECDPDKALDVLEEML